MSIHHKSTKIHVLQTTYSKKSLKRINDNTKLFENHSTLCSSEMLFVYIQTNYEIVTIRVSRTMHEES